LIATSSYSQADSSDFVTSWITDRSGLSLNDSLIIINTDPNYQYNFDIDWEDDGVFDTLGVTSTIEHVYDRVDTFTVRIRGQFPRPFFGWNPVNSRKLHAIEQWGTTYWKNMSIAFAYGELIIRDSLPPRMDSVRNCSAMFKGNIVRGDFSVWDMSKVENMDDMFHSSNSSELNIENWDVTNVITMESMFANCDSFNSPIVNWDVSKVQNMKGMFEGADLFNQPIGNWDVSSVKNMSYMFSGTDVFNQDLNNWNVSSVLYMSHMFYWTQFFDQKLNSWDVANVVNMRSMFEWSSFNSNIQNWDVSNVTDFRAMFNNDDMFNQDLSNWQTTSAQNMSVMFLEADNFNSDISSWDMSNVLHINAMFQGADEFDQDLSNWSIENVLSARNMFNSSGMSLMNYDSTLIGWASQNINANVELGAVGLKFCKADSARTSMINRGWTFVGDSLDCPVGLSEHKEKADFLIWPNPAQDFLNILTDSNRKPRLRIVGLDGKVVMQKELSRPSSRLDVSHLTKGIYIIQIGSESKKLIIAN
jgi:surface protein